MKIRFVLLVAALVGCASNPQATECETGIICPPETQCAAVQRICIMNNCGNGLLDPGEECDRGDIEPGGGCSSDCQIEECGNGEQDPGEACDVGDTTAGDGCSPECQVEECGNLTIDFGETCDDGGEVPADGCSATCQTEICGNGVKDPGEQCDDGDQPGGCNPDCEGGEGCGDGAIDLDTAGNPLEECDDGNASDDDDCLSSNTSPETNCKISTCGDGVRQLAGSNLEQCDDAGESAGCNNDCTVSVCNDGKVNKQDGEQCDDGAGNNANNRDCTALCVLNVCNDGHHNTAGPDNQEQCDDGNTSETDGCSTACTTPFCGNGIVDQNEACDFGVGLNSDNGACKLDCQINVCGDGEVRTGVEQCDDGDTINGTNNCSAICRNEVCGNGIKDPLEACDDGNTGNDDGCSSVCEIETCGDGVENDLTEECDTSGESATCNANCTDTECGDGIANEAAGEQCDELNAVNTDNCISNNHPNAALRCKVNVCGDGVADNALPRIEQCDDGNQINNDGCNVNCTFSSCGNGIRDQGEACDDGNVSDLDACVGCADAFCGDGKIRTGVEACDDGDVDNGDGCDTNCKVSACGNGIKAGSEGCDDGNLTNGDGCSATCSVETCGNGTEDFGEECDDAGESATCNADCTDVQCGDLIVNTSAGEQCDENNAINTDNCISNNHPNAALRCKLNVCGDNVIDNASPRVEGCDDGNQINNDGCSNACTLPACGNGILDQGEQCDDGNTADNDGCLSSNSSGATNCKIAICGDNVRRTVGTSGLEECDDGDSDNNDNCLNTCKNPTCGDGFVDLEGTGAAQTELCDDGNGITEAECPYNVIDCDVCAAGCDTLVARTGDFCGDGTVDTADGEVCDDGNRVAESSCPYGQATCDLCNANCSAELPLNGPTCGDGDIEAGVEVCDDNNNLACGTCNNTCTVAQTDKAEGFIFPASGPDYTVGGTDTFTLDDGINPPRTFQFTNGTPTGTNIAITFGTETNVQMRDKIRAAIDGIGDTLRIDASVSGSNPTVILIHDFATSQGNSPIVEAVATPNFAVFGMVGGQGGDCGDGTGCELDSDCESFDCSALLVCEGP